MNDWEQRWREGRTGWDAGGSPPVLRELLESGTLPEGPALVPGCGAGYDVLALASPRRPVLGLDIAPTAAQRFEALREAAGVPSSLARVEVQDFFTWTPPTRFSLIWDYTFLCAIRPPRRPEWALRMDALLAPGGELVTLLFPVTGVRPTLEAPGEGPPFVLHPEHARELLAPTFTPVHLAPVERSHPARAGREWLGRWRRTSEVRPG